MSRLFESLNTRITAAFAALTLFIVGGILYDWYFVQLPRLRSGEAVKADLLITPYAYLLQEAVQRQDWERIEGILTQISLLEHRPDGRGYAHKMVQKITVTTLEGRGFSRENGDVAGRTSIVVEVPLFSEETQMLEGTVSLAYNDVPLHELISYGWQRILWGLLAIVAVLAAVLRITIRLVNPLRKLAVNVNEIESLTTSSLASAPEGISVEIQQVWTAVDMLLQRLERREREIVREHKEVEKALKAKIAAESASQAKSTFLATMSHELRTPLNAIIGYSEMLAEDALERGLLEQEADLQKIGAAGKHLLSLINDILDLSKIEAGKMKVEAERFSIVQVVQQTAVTIDPLVRKNNNKLKIDCPAAIGEMVSDPRKVTQILINLLSNACKFTSDGEIKIVVSTLRDQYREYIKFSVTDSGIGIAPEDLDKLFEVFVQADSSTTRKFEGTGLGLALCRRLCRMMGGEIDTTSELGHGSTFAFWLPREIAGEEIPESGPVKFAE